MCERLPFELTVPGTWVDLPDQDAAWQIGLLIHSLVSAFHEATAACLLFERDLAQAAPALRDWEADTQRRVEIEMSLQGPATDLPIDPEEWERRRLDVDRELCREKVRAGVLPQQLRHMLPFIHAKAFIYALDGVGKIMKVLAARGDAPAAADSAVQGFYDHFPTLVAVRDSTQHMEDRGRGLDRKGNPLQLKPIQNGLINAPQGALALNNLNGNRFGTTGAVPLSWTGEH